jgi:UDP-glucuronate 4-epimerase
MNILITGCAGFIGFHLSDYLLKNTDHKIYGIDNLNKYYSVKLKKDRLRQLVKFKNFNFKKIDISSQSILKIDYKPEIIINLAAQAGVRYSFKNPDSYIKSNIYGFNNILELARMYSSRLIYASSSSVYGNKKTPFSERIKVDNALNLYASTKIFNESQASVYANNFKINTVGLRFFTVYGPWGRPDMFIHKIFDAIKNNKEVELYNFGNNFRDFTYVADVVRAISLILADNSYQKNNIYNISNGKSYKVKTLVSKIEKITNKKLIKKNVLPAEGDMYITKGSITKIYKKYNFKSLTEIDKGLEKYFSWYEEYYK